MTSHSHMPVHGTVKIYLTPERSHIDSIIRQTRKNILLKTTVFSKSPSQVGTVSPVSPKQELGGGVTWRRGDGDGICNAHLLSTEL